MNDGTHQDWLEGQASDRLEREAYDLSRFDDRVVLQGDGWEIVRVENLWTLDFDGVGSFTDNEMVALANAILTEVEIAQRPQPQPEPPAYLVWGSTDPPA